MRKAGQPNPRKAVEETLLLLMGERREITITHPVLADEAGVSISSVSRARRWLSTTDRWEITTGIGRSETTYRYLAGK